jgi:hypothetical protein
MDAGRLSWDQQFESGVRQQRVCGPALEAFISAQPKNPSDSAIFGEGPKGVLSQVLSQMEGQRTRMV